MSKMRVPPSLTEPTAQPRARNEQFTKLLLITIVMRLPKERFGGAVNVSDRQTSQPGKHLPNKVMFELNSKDKQELKEGRRRGKRSRQTGEGVGGF